MVNQLVDSGLPRGKTCRSTSTAKFPHCYTKKKNSHRLLSTHATKEIRVQVTDSEANRDDLLCPQTQAPGHSAAVSSLLFCRLAIFTNLFTQKRYDPVCFLIFSISKHSNIFAKHLSPPATTDSRNCLLNVCLLCMLKES